MIKVHLAARTAVVMMLPLMLAGCDTSQPDAIEDYKKLCEIYEEIVPLQIDELEKVNQIVKRVHTELPDVYPHYAEISDMDPGDVYSTTQQIAKYETGQEWECSTMRSFYSQEAN